MRIKSCSILLLFAWLMAACQPVPLDPLPPIVTPVRIVLTPATGYFAAAIERCTSEFPDITATVQIFPLNEARGAVYDLAITSGEGLTDHMYSLGNDDLAVIVHPSNPVSSLTADQISGIFSGHLPTWSSVMPEQSVIEPDQPIQLFAYSEEDDLGKLFKERWMPNRMYNLRVFFAPGPQEMVQAVSEDPATIGYIPAVWMTSAVKRIDLPEDSTYPIVMSTLKEPEGGLRSLMGCLQKTVEK